MIPLVFAWHLAAETVTDVPLDVGVRVAAEAPGRVRLSTSLGILPGPYVDLINAGVEAFGGYNDQTAQLIKDSLSSSLVWRTHAGWRPLRRHGLTIDIGYGLVALGGGVSGEEVIMVATGHAPPPGENAPMRSYHVASVLHMIDAEIGWEWRLPHGLMLRTALGFAGTLAASTSVSPNYTPRDPRVVSMFTTAAASYLDDTYTSYVFAPVVTVGVAYRFF